MLCSLDEVVWCGVLKLKSHTKNDSQRNFKNVPMLQIRFGWQEDLARMRYDHKPL
jgi:hypothetical protein